MIRGVLHTARKAIDKYRADGIMPLLQTGHRYGRYKIRSKALRGERQFKCLTSLRYRVHKFRYTAPADPYEPIWVDVANIDRFADMSPDYGLGQIRTEDWDLSENHTFLEDQPVYKGLKQRFEDGRAWEETVYYQSAKEEFERGGSKWGYQDLEQFRSVRCAFVDTLYETVRDEGYRPNFELEHDVPESDVRGRGSSYHSTLEPLVTIGKNGGLYLCSGRHRYSITKILGITSIPVNVLARHREWQRVRDEIDRAETASELRSGLQGYLDHPDLEDVVPDSWACGSQDRSSDKGSLSEGYYNSSTRDTIG